MTLNLDKNKTVLVHAWKEVLDERNPINWALFGYDGQTYDLNLVGKGDGGLEELIDDFNSGKIQYALCRVNIKERNIEKIVLINWQGEGAPLARKGTCANHLETVKSFFKGVHVTINARTDEDVEPDLILQTVGKAIAGEGVKMSSAVEPDVGPIGTVYKRVNPQEEINSKAKDDFWRKQEQEEQERRKKDSPHRKFSQDEVKLLRKESQDYFDKDEKEQAEMKYQSQIKTTTPSPQPQSQNGFSNSNGHQHQKSNSISPIPQSERAAATAAALQASTPMKNNSNSALVRQRIKSFDGGSGPVFPQKNQNSNKVNGGSNHNNSGSNSLNLSTNNNSHSNSWAKSPSPTPPASMPPVASNKSNGSASNADSISVLRRKQMFESGGATNNATSGAVVKRNPAEEIRQAQEEMKKQQLKEQQEMKEKEKQNITTNTTTVPVPRLSPVPVKQQEEEEEPRIISPVAHFQSNIIPKTIPETNNSSSSVASQKAAFFNNPTTNVPVIPIVSKSPSPVPVVAPKSPSPQPPPPLQFQNSPVTVTEPEEFEEIHEDTSVRSAENSFREASPCRSPIGQSASPVSDSADTITINITPEMGTCARALYDYQAADETEITFDPGDIIKNIEKIDEGWWEGLGPGNLFGLFPANYVELLN